VIVGLVLGAAGVLLFLLPTELGRLLGGALFAICLATLPRRSRWGWIAFGASTVVIGGAIYGLTLPGDSPASIGPIRFGVQGAVVGAAEMVRVLGLFSIGLLAARWIPIDDFLPLVSRRPFPLYIAASLLRLVPALREDFERIRRTQVARGLEPRGWWTRPARFVPIIVPLFVNALRRARDQALALELAGLGRRRA
jgi:energy-coupling factor transporter transmembrane protein EcfT